MRKLVSMAMVWFLILGFLCSVSATQSHAGNYMGDFCWNFSNTIGETTASGIIKLGISHMGGSHYLCSGVISVTDPVTFQMPAFGNVELVDNKFYVTLTWQGRKYDTPSSYTVGNETATVVLDPKTLSGTLVGSGVYYDDFESFYGTVTLTSCF